MVKRVEKHIIINNKSLDNLCFLSKNLYNYANYCVRRRFIKSGRFISAYTLINIFVRINQIDYRKLPAQTAQQVLFQLEQNWKSFFKVIKDYKKNKSKYEGKPNLPNFKKKNGRNVVIFTNQQVKLINGYIYFPKMSKINPLKTKIKNICQVRIIPQQSCNIIEVIYKKEIKVNENLDKNLYLGIDLGVNNLATLISNSDKLNPLLLNGKILKSINQFYNQSKAKLMSYVGNKGISKRLKHFEFSRKCKIDNYLHHTSRFIINYCIENNLGNIVIGYNEGWKNDINIGKVNNQKFVYIPYLTLINQIKYKAEEVGIKVETIKESYTSKCDSLALEEIKKQEEYLGKRIKRGLFQSSIGKLINADVNGALNILRKVIGDDFVKNLINKSCVLQPIKINLIKN